MPIELTLTWPDTTPATEHELMEDQRFAERVPQGELEDPLINCGFAAKVSLFLQVFRCKADELWSFVGNKANK